MSRKFDLDVYEVRMLVELIQDHVLEYPEDDQEILNGLVSHLSSVAGLCE